MTSSSAEPPLAPDELVSTGGERQVLEAFLDLYRAIVIRKIAGLSDEQLRRHWPPSQMTLGGLIKHLAAVEREWFQTVLDGRADDGPNETTSADSWTLTIESGPDLLAEYQRACAASRQIASRFALEETVPHPRLGQVSLRWIYIHMVEESARHAGHADIFRENTDGATGFDG